MKYFPFKILIAGILLPPICYLISLQYLETCLTGRYAREIEEIYIGDTRPLFNGTESLEAVINRNIDAYLGQRPPAAWGIEVAVTVTTRQGKVIYPSNFQDGEADGGAADPLEVADRNYHLMQDGLVVNLTVAIRHNKWLSNLILAGYVMFFLLAVSFYYRSGVRKSRMEAQQQDEAMRRLRDMEKIQSARLAVLNKNRQVLAGEIRQIKKQFENEKAQASRNEDHFIEEIVALESKLSDNLAVQDQLQTEIETLEKEIAAYRKDKSREDRQIRKNQQEILKRFAVLYKNVTVHDRAGSGFMNRTADMQIKGEELIAQLNQDPQTVPVKRKVFSRKGRIAVLELLFAYKGRLYFRNTGGKIDVLSIGTKNSQARDLEFLDSIHP